MKPTMLVVILSATAIILASSFGLHIGDIAPLYNLSTEQLASALYVCPAADSVFDSVAATLRIASRFINMFFFFTAMLLIFFWIWKLYKSLLEDSYKDGTFDQVWEFSKIWFWGLVVSIVLLNTPNIYRTVSVDGATGNYVLCEQNTPGAIPVRATSVKHK